MALNSIHFIQKRFLMIYVGIDVAKDKHDCFIANSDDEVLFKPFTISNNREDFETLFHRIQSVSDDLTKVKIGLETTGHYSYNLLRFLLDESLTAFVINPLRTNLYRKSLSLRKTKTDKVDSRTIATMMMSDVNLKPYSDISYRNGELKPLTRYRFDKIKERAKLNSSVSRLVCILFFSPNWKNSPLRFIWHLFMLCFLNFQVQILLQTHTSQGFPTCSLKVLMGRYGKDTSVMFRDAAKGSIVFHMPANPLEPKHTIKFIQKLTAGYRMGAMIIAEIGDFSRDKILAYGRNVPLHLSIQTVR